MDQKDEVTKGVDKSKEGKEAQGGATEGVKSRPYDTELCEAHNGVHKGKEENKAQGGATEEVRSHSSDKELHEACEGISNGKEENDGQGLSDKEFNELLDNALSDFLVNCPNKGSESDDLRAESKGAASPDMKFDDLDFMYEELRKLELSGDPNFDVNPIIEKFTKVAEKADPTEEGADMKYIVETVMDAIKNMSETAQDMQIGDGYLDLMNMVMVQDDEAADLPPEELAKIMVPPEDLARSREMNINPFIMRLMSMCLSKNILYTPMKGLVSQFPEWLAVNEPTLSADEYSKRVKQLDLLQKICAEYEKEEPTDSEEVKSQRFKTIMDLMQELRCYGQPPSELLGGIPLSPFRFDMTGMPNMGNVPDDDMCCLM